MTRLEALNIVLINIEGGGDYQDMYDRAHAALAKGKMPRFTKYEKELLAYKFESNMLDEEDVEALEMITGSKDWCPELRDWR